MNRRSFLKTAGLATAGALVASSAVHDFLEWQNRRIFTGFGMRTIHAASEWIVRPGQTVSNARIRFDRSGRIVMGDGSRIEDCIIEANGGLWFDRLEKNPTGWSHVIRNHFINNHPDRIYGPLQLTRPVSYVD